MYGFTFYDMWILNLKLENMKIRKPFLFLALICGGQVLWLVWALAKYCWCSLSVKRCPYCI